MIINLNTITIATTNTCLGIVTDEVRSFVYSMDVNQRGDWYLLELMINQVQNNFSKRLRIDYPMLTEHDVRFILLIRIHLNHSRIAWMMNIETSSFRIGRYRLKKKMGVETDSFSDFIRKLYV